MCPSPAVPLEKAQAPAHSRRLLRALYVVIAFSYWMALYLYVPTLPTYVESKSESLAIEEAIHATAMLTFVGSMGWVTATSMTGALNQWGGTSILIHLLSDGREMGE